MADLNDLSPQELFDRCYELMERLAADAVKLREENAELADMLSFMTAQIEGELEGEDTHPLWADVKKANALIAKARGHSTKAPDSE